MKEWETPIDYSVLPIISWCYRSSGTVRLANSSGTHHHEDSSRDEDNDAREKYLSIGVWSIIFMSMFTDIAWCGPSRTNINPSRRLLRLEIMLEISRMVVGVFLGPRDETSGTEPTTTSRRRNGLPSHPRCERIPTERTPIIPMFLSTGKEQLKSKCVKEPFHADSSSLELLMRTILAVNQITIHHAASIWHDQVQKVMCDNDVTTIVQHVTQDLAPRERDATHRRQGFKSTGEVPKRSWIFYDCFNETNICDETVQVVGNFGYHDDLHTRIQNMQKDPNQFG